MGQVVIALGSNLGAGAENRDSFHELSLAALESHQIEIRLIAPVYESVALGSSGQGVYLNSVIAVSTSLSPYSLLRRLKQVERASGRRGYGRPWSARTLDLDIISYDQQILNWDLSSRSPLAVKHGHLNIPHSQAHRRSFVLQPLQDILPKWRHPVLGGTVFELNKRLKTVNKRSGGEIIRVI